MITKATIKTISSLATAKGRRQANAFCAEGTKCVIDTLCAFSLRHLFCTQDWLENHNLDENAKSKVEIANRGELKAMSSLTTVADVIAVYDLPGEVPFESQKLANELILALDRVQDPGNLGTIIRTADWMGVKTILASTETADCFNPKVVQATMGAISRVKIIYGNLPEMLRALKTCGAPVFGTFLDGENIYKTALTPAGVIVMGNEGQGISPQVAATVTKRLLIPSFPPDAPTSESLNVATATAITLSQFRAQQV